MILKTGPDQPVRSIQPEASVSGSSHQKKQKKKKKKKKKKKIKKNQEPLIQSEKPGTRLVRPIQEQFVKMSQHDRFGQNLDLNHVVLTSLAACIYVHCHIVPVPTDLGSLIWLQ
jgi:hypothetical protein